MMRKTCCLFLAFLLTLSFGCASTDKTPEQPIASRQAAAKPKASAKATPTRQRMQVMHEAAGQLKKKGKAAATAPLGQAPEPPEFPEDEGRVVVPDPLEGWNRAVFWFNDWLYTYAIDPVARGYAWALPEDLRSVVSNFYYNLITPLRLVSALLQGKVGRAGSEAVRFVINTTVGGGGFGDPAGDVFKVAKPPPEDLGQTMATWGLGHGFYVVWPILGPSSARDTVGKVGGWYLDPIFYIVTPVEAAIAIRAHEFINQISLHLGEYESLKESSLDPYVAVRDAYIQFRDKQAKE